MIQYEDIKFSLNQIPFKTTLSFEYLLEELKEMSRDKNNPLTDSASKMLRKVDQVPELKKPIRDFSIVDKHRELVNQLMAFVFSSSADDATLSAASQPFTPKTFYSTKLFDETIKGEHRKLQMAKEINEDNLDLIRL